MMRTLQLLNGHNSGVLRWDPAGASYNSTDHTHKSCLSVFKLNRKEARRCTACSPCRVKTQSSACPKTSHKHVWSKCKKRIFKHKALQCQRAFSHVMTNLPATLYMLWIRYYLKIKEQLLIETTHVRPHEARAVCVKVWISTCSARCRPTESTDS